MSDAFDYIYAIKSSPRECHRPTAPDHPLTWVPDTVEFLSIFGPARVGDSLVEFHEQRVEKRKERFARETQDFEKCQSSLPEMNYQNYPYRYRYEQNFRRARPQDQLG